LSVRIAGQVAAGGQTLEHDDLVATSVDLAQAWKKLTAMHQEALSLSVWEGLSRAQAAQVLGISAVAYRIRTEPGTGASPRSHRRRRAIRFVLAGVVASAGVAAAPILGTGDAALATWDAEPRPAATQEAAENATKCAAWTGVPLGSYEPKVVEMRGSGVMTYLASADGEAQCLQSTITITRTDGTTFTRHIKDYDVNH
jgi:hypothetical protein